LKIKWLSGTHSTHPYPSLKREGGNQGKRSCGKAQRDAFNSSPPQFIGERHGPNPFLKREGGIKERGVLERLSGTHSTHPPNELGARPNPSLKREGGINVTRVLERLSGTHSTHPNPSLKREGGSKELNQVTVGLFFSIVQSFLIS
jgi:hypothetical protein